jgi:GR25 family glycosyltransferase involved in LPS biosynthesis
MNNIPILYINLEHRKDRNEQIIDELNKYNLTAERVEAIKHIDGCIGCGLSHIKCLDLAIERNYEEVIILEDDFIFLQNPDKLNLNINFDIFLLGGTIYKSEKENNFNRVIDASRTEGYIIKKHYYETLKKCFNESVENLLIKHEHKYKLDILWKQLQIKDNFYFNDFGLIGGQREGYSDIENKNMKRKNYKCE